jgi:hypothetical protein
MERGRHAHDWDGGRLAPRGSATTSYLAWSDKGVPTLARYPTGLILILASRLLLGSLIALPFTLFGLTVLSRSVVGQILGY